MITLLSKFFIKNREDTSSPEVRQRYGILSGAVGIFFNLLLFTGKFIAGSVSHSIAITADAFNNLSDAASSVIQVSRSEARPRPPLRARQNGIPVRSCGCRRHFNHGI